MKPLPIAVVGYNRPDSLTRVLSSLQRADLPANVPLHLFIDGGGPNGTEALCRSFEWSRGEKHLHLASQRMGMRENSLRAADLAISEGGVIFLEDDSAVSPSFYSFSIDSFSKFTESTEVNSVSLYGFEFCEFDQLRFQPIIDGYDNYYVGSATTWAVLFLRSGWGRFRRWLSDHGRSQVVLSDGVPDAVTQWPSTSWKRYINKYLAASGELFCYPRASYATNFADAGSHFLEANNNYRVPIAYGYSPPNLSLPHVSRARYDPFFEMHGDLLRRYLPLSEPGGIDVDLRGIKRRCQLHERMVLSIRQLTTPIKTFGSSRFPLEANVIEGSEGGSINFGRRCALTDKRLLSEVQLCRYYHHDLGGKREIKLAASRLFRSTSSGNG